MDVMRDTSAHSSSMVFVFMEDLVVVVVIPCILCMRMMEEKDKSGQEQELNSQDTIALQSIVFSMSRI